MLHFTKYAEEKFEILNKYGVFFTREQVEEAIKTPDRVVKKGKYRAAKKDSLKVIYHQEGEVTRVVTFYPVK